MANDVNVDVLLEKMIDVEKIMWCWVISIYLRK